MMAQNLIDLVTHTEDGKGLNAYTIDYVQWYWRSHRGSYRFI